MQGNRLVEMRWQEVEDRSALAAAQPGFAVCPVELAPWQQQLYLAAYAAARDAAVRSFRRQACTFSWN